MFYLVSLDFVWFDLLLGFVFFLVFFFLFFLRFAAFSSSLIFLLPFLHSIPTSLSFVSPLIPSLLASPLSSLSFR